MISFLVILLRLVVAIALGSLVGIQREIHEHSAGMRTIALVTLGSTLFTIVSAYGFLDLLGIAHLSIDPTRIASYIVAGIGFLGAGTIFRSRDSDRVKGLTTAATIWVTAAIGIACGAGLLLEAAVATILTLAVLEVFQRLEPLFLPPDTSENQRIQLEAEAVTGQLIASIYETCTASGVAIEKLHIDTTRESETIELVCQIQSPSAIGKAIDGLRALAGVRTIHADTRTISERTDKRAR